MKLGALIREIYDVAQPVYVEATVGYGKSTILLQCSKGDLVKHLRMIYPTTKTETELTLVQHGSIRVLVAENVEATPVAVESADLDLPFMQYASSNDYEDVSIEELAREAMDDSRQSGETERARLICEAAMRRKKGITEATAYVDRIMPRPAYMTAAKFNYETREFEDQAAAA